MTCRQCEVYREALEKLWAFTGFDCPHDAEGT
jgi:hypothetical protein